MMLSKRVWAWCLIGWFGAAAGTMAGDVGPSPSKDRSLAATRRGSSNAQSMKAQAADMRRLHRHGSATERGEDTPREGTDVAAIVYPQASEPQDPCTQPDDHCQLPDNVDAIRSDRTNFVVAEGFSPAQTGPISEICWWGAYSDGVGDCQGTAPDTFEVKYYANADGYPDTDTLLGFFSQVGETLTVNGPVATGDYILGFPEYEFSATHATVDVTAGQCYWIEVSNSVSDTTCGWFWEVSASGDGRICQDGMPLDGYGLEDIRLDFGDQAFCVDLPLGDAAVCLPGTPTNDACEDSVTASDGVMYFDSTNATTDGPPTHSPPAECHFVYGYDHISQDIWFDYQATCSATLEVSLCGSWYDTRLAVYEGNDCPEPVEDALTCNDDFCGPPDEPPWPYQSQVSLPVTENEMYKIRVGGVSDYLGGDGGWGVMRVSCGETPPNDNCVNADFASLPVGSSHVFTGTNERATHECDEFAGAHVWIAFDLPEDAWVTLEYCDTNPPFANANDKLALDCPCTTGNITEKAIYDETCSSNPNRSLIWRCLPQGTYYYPVLSEPGSEGQYTITVAAYPCCADATGSCFEPNGTPGCDDWDCCDVVCDYDPYCCVMWDELCAREAVPLCQGLDVFCADAMGDCCSAHTPEAGCEEGACCVAVCGLDLYCCTHKWDGICAGEAVDLCGPLCRGCPDGDVTFDAFFDARQPHPVDATTLEGVRTFGVTAPLNIYDMSCWSLCETNQNPDLHPGLDPPIGENDVEDVAFDPETGKYAITLIRPIAHGEVAVITYDNLALDGTTVATGRFAYHPADVNGTETSTQLDIWAVIDSLNGTDQLANERADVDRDGQQGPGDVLRVIDLLNGAGAFEPWLDVTVDHAAPCP